MPEKSNLIPLGQVGVVVMGQSPQGDQCNRDCLGDPLLNGPTEFGERFPVPAQWTTSPTKWAEPGDVLFCVRGSTTGRMNRADQRYVIGRGVAAVRGADLVDTGFLHYVLINDLDSLLRLTTGSTFPNISRDSLLQLVIPWPSRNERVRITEVLGALDDLIETNRRLAEASEALAMTIAESATGQTPLSAMAQSLNAPVKVPRGPTDHFSLPAFDVDHLPDRIDGSLIKSNKVILDRPCVLVSRLNPHIPRVWMAYPESGVTSAASTEFVPLVGSDVCAEEIWVLCANRAFLDQMNGLVTGTTGSHQRVDKEALLTLEVPDIRSLSDSKRMALRDLVREAFDARSNARTLSRTRDELLPLLLSGAVTVAEVAA